MQRIFRVALLVVPAVMLLTAMFVRAEEAPGGARGAAFTFAKKVITPTLKDPSSADFEWESVQVDRVLPAKVADGAAAEIVCVSGIVRARNGFNAIVPSKWQVIMLYRRDKYEAIVIANNRELLLKTEEGEKFLNTLLDTHKQNKEKNRLVAAEKAEQAKEETARRARLTRAAEQGREAGDETVKRFGRNVKTASDALIEKSAKKALEKSGITESDETEQFQLGFMAVIREAKERRK